jgi:hypothetical protein
MLINLQNTSDLTNHLNSLDTFVIIRHHSSSSVQASFPSLAPERLIASEAGVLTTIILALLLVTADLAAGWMHVVVHCLSDLQCTSQIFFDICSEMLKI